MKEKLQGEATIDGATLCRTRMAAIEERLAALEARVKEVGELAADIDEDVAGLHMCLEDQGLWPV